MPYALHLMQLALLLCLLAALVGFYFAVRRRRHVRLVFCAVMVVTLLHFVYLALLAKYDPETFRRVAEMPPIM
jgi:putative effector of murein hydrolase